jgi:phage-related protein
MVTQASKLAVGSLTTMMSIDFSRCISFTPTGTTTLNFSSNRNGGSNITYNGTTYEYVGFDTSGFSSELNGKAPAPVITFDKASLLSNTNYTTLWDQFTAQTGEEYFDWRGAIVQIFRTINLDTTQQLSLQEYVVAQVNKVTSSVVEVQLAVSLGIDRISGNSIQTLSMNRCALRYRTWNGTGFDYTAESAGGCPYGNPTTVSNWSAVPSFGVLYFTNTDQQLADANKNLDKCSYSVKGCQSRFDPNKDGLTLPFVGLYSPSTIGK